MKPLYIASCSFGKDSIATRRRADGLVTTDAGRDLTDKELRAYCRWGLAHGYTRLKELPEFETIEKELKL